MKKYLATFICAAIVPFALFAQSTDINFGSTFSGQDGLFYADPSGTRFDTNTPGLIAVGYFGDITSNTTFSDYLSDFNSFGSSSSNGIATPGYWQGDVNAAGDFSTETPYVVVLGGVFDFASAASATSFAVYTDTTWSIAAPASPTPSATDLLTLQPDTIVMDSLNTVTGGYELNTVTTAVPEPSTYAMMLGALALGFVAYRRRRS